ncbi:hypothetical protein AWENTII_010022 [Aspergillus wentii]
MWLYRGVQSAVFYYATCTPCANSLDRRKRKKDAARSQREKEKTDAIVSDQPRPFPQPTPFSTNQGWREEIALGPGPPARRGGNRHNRRPESWDTDGYDADSDLRSGGGGRSGKKKDKGSSLKHPLSDRWSRMRYQREDEPLWGEDVEVKGSSIGLSGRGKAESDEPSKYYIARVPPVNDLHPPIVSGPKSRAETRWMLQPPPSAKVMAGKQRFDSSNRTNDRLDQDKNAVDPERSSSPFSATGQKSPPSSSQNPEKRTLKPSPITVPPEFRAQKASAPESTTGQNIRQPSSTALTHGRDESNFVISHPITSRPGSPSTISTTDSETSPSVWQCPVTPASRPGSKATDDKLCRQPLSQVLPTVQRGSKDVHMLQLEINDDTHDEVGFGQTRE